MHLELLPLLLLCLLRNRALRGSELSFLGFVVVFCLVCDQAKPPQLDGTTLFAQIDSCVGVFYLQTMNSVIQAPSEWIESVGNLHLPAKADLRLQGLMDRNNEGLLNESEREELEALAELSERLSLVRAEALELLGKKHP